MEKNMMKLKRLIKENLSAHDLRDAYSYSILGDVILEGIIESLRSVGYSDNMIESIVRSKHTRWFMNQHDHEFHELAIKLFKNYLSSNMNKIKSDFPLEK